MPDSRRASCKNCGRHKSECGPISWAGYCDLCGPFLAWRNNDALHYKKGGELLRWRRGVAASVGAVLLDDLNRQTA